MKEGYGSVQSCGPYGLRETTSYLGELAQTPVKSLS